MLWFPRTMVLALPLSTVCPFIYFRCTKKSFFFLLSSCWEKYIFLIFGIVIFSTSETCILFYFFHFFFLFCFPFLRANHFIYKIFFSAPHISRGFYIPNESLIYNHLICIRPCSLRTYEQFIKFTIVVRYFSFCSSFLLPFIDGIVTTTTLPQRSYGIGILLSSLHYTIFTICNFEDETRWNATLYAWHIIVKSP